MGTKGAFVTRAHSSIKGEIAMLYHIHAGLLVKNAYTENNTTTNHVSVTTPVLSVAAKPRITSQPNRHKDKLCALYFRTVNCLSILTTNYL